jgi:hypothetical protein
MHQAKLPWRWVSSCPRRGSDRSHLGFSRISSLPAMCRNGASQRDLGRPLFLWDVSVGGYETASRVPF